MSSTCGTHTPYSGHLLASLLSTFVGAWLALKILSAVAGMGRRPLGIGPGGPRLPLGEMTGVSSREPKGAAGGGRPANQGRRRVSGSLVAWPDGWQKSIGA